MLGASLLRRLHAPICFFIGLSEKGAEFVLQSTVLVILGEEVFHCHHSTLVFRHLCQVLYLHLDGAGDILVVCGARLVRTCGVDKLLAYS